MASAKYEKVTLEDESENEQWKAELEKDIQEIVLGAEMKVDEAVEKLEIVEGTEEKNEAGIEILMEPKKKEGREALIEGRKKFNAERKKKREVREAHNLEMKAKEVEANENRNLARKLQGTLPQFDQSFINHLKKKAADARSRRSK